MKPANRPKSPDLAVFLFAATPREFASASIISECTRGPHRRVQASPLGRISGADKCLGYSQYSGQPQTAFWLDYRLNRKLSTSTAGLALAIARGVHGDKESVLNQTDVYLPVQKKD